MREGSFLLLDEISLADDAVLERLNSVLEPGRKLTLAEKGGDVVEEIVAHPNFRIFATMNPGGDFGKKELSPALRNRFTEIWVPEITDPDDLRSIIRDQMQKHGDHVVEFTEPMLDFVTWFNEEDFGSSSRGSSSRGSSSSSAGDKKKKKRTR
jgi:midasin